MYSMHKPGAVLIYLSKGDGAMENHSIFIEERKKMTVTGVTDVDGFNEEIVKITLKEKRLTVKGKNLHIENLDTAGEKLTVTGEIESVEYTTAAGEKSLVRKILK